MHLNIIKIRKKIYPNLQFSITSTEIKISNKNEKKKKELKNILIWKINQRKIKKIR